MVQRPTRGEELLLTVGLTNEMFTEAYDGAARLEDTNTVPADDEVGFIQHARGTHRGNESVRGTQQGSRGSRCLLGAPDGRGLTEWPQRG